MTGLDDLMFGLIRDRRSGTDRHQRDLASPGSVDLLDMLVDARGRRHRGGDVRARGA